MKKKFLTGIMLIITSLCLCFGLSACDGKVEISGHIHEYVWQHDDTQHWQACKDDNAEKSGSRGTHYDNDNNGKCDVCQCDFDNGNGDPTAPTEYTVTFNANGGLFANEEATKSVKVKENEKVQVPEQPTRDNYEFVQWCTDNSLDTAWVFAADTVTHDVTLYAKWDSTATEHNVRFILNYAGAEEVVKSTVDGLITYIPERNGYVFNGWWFSDGQTEDGEYILAQKYDTSELVTDDDLVLVAEWVEKSTYSSQLPAPSVSINSNVFSWPEIAGAVSYDVEVYQSGVRKSQDNIHTTSWTFPSEYEAGYYTIKIRARGDGSTTINSAYVSKSYAHNILGPISNIEFNIDTSMLTWTAVKYATEYELYVNSQLVETLTYTAYDLSNYEAGTYTIKIIAKKSGYQSSVVTKSIEKKRLKTPINIQTFVNSATKDWTITWDAVAHADTYKLKIGNQVFEFTGTSYVISNSLNLWVGQTLTFTIQAFDSNTDYLISNSTAEFTLYKAYTLTVDSNIEEAGEHNVEGDVYPQEFVVSFDVKYSNVDRIPSQVVTPTKGLTYPPIPKLSGFLFTGWYIDEARTQLFDFTLPITKDMTLYAGWYDRPISSYGLDILSQYNTSDCKSWTIYSATSEAKGNCLYFSVLTSGSYTFYYKSGTCTDTLYFELYNITKGDIKIVSATTKATTYASQDFTADAGDVLYVKTYTKSSKTNDNSTYYIYITGARIPAAGGNEVRGDFTHATQSKQTNMLVEYGTDLTITATTTDDRYIFEGWYIGDDLVTTNTSFTYTMTDQNAHYTARWKYYSITLDKNIEEGGTADNYVDQPFKVGESVTINATTNPGYMWLGWYDGDQLVSREAHYTFTMTADNIHYTARWIQPLVLTKNIEEAGTITQFSKPLVLGQKTTITAATNGNYTWLGWFENGQLKTMDLSFEVELTEASNHYEARWAGYTLTTNGNDPNAGTYTVCDGLMKVAGKSITLKATTRKGYTFIGWYEGDQLISESETYSFNMPSKSVTYTATWTYYTLTTTLSDSKAGVIYINGAQLLYTDEKVTAGNQLSLSAKLNYGYTWVGWYRDGVEVSKDTNFKFTMPRENVTLEARWTYYTVTATINDPNAGTIAGYGSLLGSAGSIENVKVSVGQNTTLKATTNDHYTWLGWYEGDALVCKDLTFSFKMTEKNVHYVATWIPCQITLQNDNDDAGTIADLPLTTIEGEDITLSATPNDGYSFLGWYEGEDLVSSLAEYTFPVPREKVVYTAKWECYTLNFETDEGGSVSWQDTSYTVSFDLNGAEGYIEPQRVTEQVGLKYPEIPTRKDHIFMGWCPDQTCSSYFDFTQTITSDITLYAHWIQKNDYSQLVVNQYTPDNPANVQSTIRYYFSVPFAGQYVIGYELTDIRNQVSIYVYKADEPEPYRYNLYRNQFSANGSDTIKHKFVPGIVYVLEIAYEANVSLYFTYASDSNMPFDGGTLADNGIKNVENKITAGEQITLTATPNSGYTFDGWYDGDQLMSRDLVWTFAMPNKNVNYHAKWILCPVSVEVSDENAGSVSELPEETIIGQEVTLTATTNPGYTFVGWYDETGLKSRDLTYTFNMPDTKTTITAKWIKVTIESGRPEAGQVESLDQTYLYDQSVTVTATTNPGYTFVGWYKDDERVSTELAYNFNMPEEDVTYTAKWIKVTLAVNKPNAGYVSTLDQAYLVGDSVTVTAYTNMGYTWIGWYNEAGECLTEGEEYSLTFDMPEQDTTYTATWICVTVAKNYNGGVVTGLEDTFVPSDSVTLNATTHIGYTWEGWYKNGELVESGTSYTFEMPSADQTIVATWKLNEEMTPFEFESTESTCVITGIKDTSIWTITIPACVTDIANDTFIKCYRLVEVYNLTQLRIRMGYEDFGYVGYYALDVYNSLEEESKIIDVDGYKFRYYSPNQSATLIGYYGEEKQLVLPAQYSAGLYTYSINKNAFRETDITSIETPVTNEWYIPAISVGEYAFKDCKNLTSVKINFSQSIDYGAFEGCGKLESLSTSYSKQIGRLFGTTAYAGSQAVKQGSTTYYIPSSLKNVTFTRSSIGENALENCSMITTVTICDDVTKIGKNAFAGCSALSLFNFNALECGDLVSDAYIFKSAATNGLTLKIGANVTKLPAYLLCQEADAESSYPDINVEFAEDSVCKSIGNFAFSNTSIEKITLPYTVESIGVSAFEGCKLLTTIDLGASIKTIGMRAFASCSALKIVKIPSHSSTRWRLTPKSGSYKVTYIYDETTAAPLLTGQYVDYTWEYWAV